MRNIVLVSLSKYIKKKMKLLKQGARFFVDYKMYLNKIVYINRIIFHKFPFVNKNFALRGGTI
jgi:hypothetical protein